MLILPTRKGTFILKTVGIGAVLSQLQEGSEKIISFFSAVHKPAEVNYSTTDQELLAVDSAIKHCRHYLLGNKFILRTNHKAITYLFSGKNLTSRLFRWSLLLQVYNFEMEYLKGQDNYSDVLSRSFEDKV